MSNRLMHPRFDAGPGDPDVAPPATRVVVGVDFSLASLAAARWAGRAFGPDVELVLVHALPILTGRSLDGDETARARERAMAGSLQGLAGLLGAGRIRTVVRRGPVADVLASVATRLRARLVCIGRDELDGQRTRRIVERVLARSAAGIAVVPRETPSDATASHIVAAVTAASGPDPALYEATLLLANAPPRPAGISTGTGRRLLVVTLADDDDVLDPLAPRHVLAELEAPVDLPPSARVRWACGAAARLTRRLRGRPANAELVHDSAARVWGASIAALVVTRPRRAGRAGTPDDPAGADAGGALCAIARAPCPVIIAPGPVAPRSARPVVRRDRRYRPPGVP